MMVQGDRVKGSNRDSKKEEKEEKEEKEVASIATGSITMLESVFTRRIL